MLISVEIDATATSVLANGQGQKYLKGDADFAPTCWASTVSGRALDALAPMGRGGGALYDFAAPSVRRMRREEWLVRRLRFGHIALL